MGGGENDVGRVWYWRAAAVFVDVSPQGVLAAPDSAFTNHWKLRVLQNGRHSGVVLVFYEAIQVIPFPANMMFLKL